MNVTSGQVHSTVEGRTFSPLLALLASSRTLPGHAEESAMLPDSAGLVRIDICASLIGPGKHVRLDAWQFAMAAVGKTYG